MLGWTVNAELAAITLAFELLAKDDKAWTFDDLEGSELAIRVLNGSNYHNRLTADRLRNRHHRAATRLLASERLNTVQAYVLRHATAILATGRKRR